MLITYSNKLHHAICVILALPALDHDPTAPNPQETRNKKQKANHKKPQASNHYQKENARFRGRYQHLNNEAYNSEISAAIRFTSS